MCSSEWDATRFIFGNFRPFLKMLEILEIRPLSHHLIIFICLAFDSFSFDKFLGETMRRLRWFFFLEFSKKKSSANGSFFLFPVEQVFGVKRSRVSSPSLVMKLHSMKSRSFDFVPAMMCRGWLNPTSSSWLVMKSDPSRRDPLLFFCYSKDP